MDWLWIDLALLSPGILAAGVTATVAALSAFAWRSYRRESHSQRQRRPESRP